MWHTESVPSSHATLTAASLNLVGMSGFEPPANRRAYLDQGFVPPNRNGQQNHNRPPIKHFSSGESVTTPPLPLPQQQQPASSGVFSSFFRKRSSQPPPSRMPSNDVSPTLSAAGPKAGPSSASTHSSSTAHAASGALTAPPHPRQLSSRDLTSVSQLGGTSSANTSSSHEVMLVDPYSMPRDAAESSNNNNNDKPAPASTPTSRPAPTSSSNAQAKANNRTSTASVATNATARPPSRSLHPELRSLLALNAARKPPSFLIFRRSFLLSVRLFPFARALSGLVRTATSYNFVLTGITRHRP